jgi:tRNA nucleotidyltransferase (CCA-adding enzyme)
MEPAPRRMFAVLDECGALVRVLPEWRFLDAAHALNAVDAAARRGLPLPVRYAALFAAASPDLAEQAAERLRAPSDCRELAALAARWSATIGRAVTLDAEALVDLLQRLDAFRRPDRFESLLSVWACAGVGDKSAQDLLRRAAAAARAVDAGAVAQASRGDEAAAVRAARVDAVAAVLPPGS